MHQGCDSKWKFSYCWIQVLYMKLFIHCDYKMDIILKSCILHHTISSVFIFSSILIYVDKVIYRDIITLTSLLSFFIISFWFLAALGSTLWLLLQAFCLLQLSVIPVINMQKLGTACKRNGTHTPRNTHVHNQSCVI